MTETARISKLAQALTNGAELTSAQISKVFEIANPTAAITQLRSEGYAIYYNANGTYRLGTPTRRMVAAGYAALGAREAGLTYEG